MRVLIACEFSGIVRDAFAARGHTAISCDLLPSERPGWHLRGDIRDALSLFSYDLMIAHPPCTYLSSSGARWLYNKDGTKNEERWKMREEALAFVRVLLAAPIDRIALENPVGAISSQIRKPDQYIQPWEHGDPETKTTGLWLKNLPLLTPTKVVEPDYMRNADGSFKLDKKGKRYSRIHWMRQGRTDSERSHERSRTYQGIANAMAEQWG